MNILGINAFHGDASACLVQNGKLIAAAEEERFRRIKHWAGFPSEAIRYCLETAGLSLSDVHHVAINQDSRAHRWKKLRYVLTARPDMQLVLNRLKNRKRRASLEQLLEHAFPTVSFQGKKMSVEHHLAHLASAFYVSPFREAACVSIDGFGDFSSTAWGMGSDTQITEQGRVYFPHSLGIFYQALTQYLGFGNYGDEYKIMGLAPYGKPAYLAEMREIVHLTEKGTFKLNLAYFKHHQETVEYTWEGGEPKVGQLFDAQLETLFGPARQKDEALTERHKDIARSVQAMYEEAFFHLLNHVHQKTGAEALTLAGGCAMNSVANGKVYQHTPFKKVYVQAAAGDAGGAIGAAMVCWHQTPNATRTSPISHAYWGPQSEEASVEALLNDQKPALQTANCRVAEITNEGLLCQQVATAISEGKVVGWFQGRMEWGPRALGNRSIVCDPRRADMKDILNLKIKRRESFRPFAPSILREETKNWFETDDDVPFMMQVFQIREAKQQWIPAVTHLDGSGRLQTVDKTDNPRYHRLIKAFFDMTGVPVVLNTSFNENEPIVCRLEEALDCFLRTQMDMLVLGNWVIARAQ